MTLLKVGSAFLILLHQMLSWNACAQKFDSLREVMVRDQLVKGGIKSQDVLEAMRSVKRHLFVPQAYADYAYGDFPVPIGEKQTISQPYVVAFMTESLDLRPDDRVLEIGTGSGYQAAVLSLLCKEVYSIELLPRLGLKADSLLKATGYSNVHVRAGDGYLGWPEAAPFDAIIVTCSPSKIPQPLQEQLKEGGRMIIPVGDSKNQELVLITKKDGKLKKRDKLQVLFVPMKDTKGKRY